jgi:hypothetical protein
MTSQNQEEEKNPSGFFDFRFLKKTPHLIRVPHSNPGVTPCNLNDFADF